MHKDMLMNHFEWCSKLVIMQRKKYMNLALVW